MFNWKVNFHVLQFILFQCDLLRIFLTAEPSFFMLTLPSSAIVRSYLIPVRTCVKRCSYNLHCYENDLRSPRTGLKMPIQSAQWCIKRNETLNIVTLELKAIFNVRHNWFGKILLLYIMWYNIVLYIDLEEYVILHVIIY